MAEARKIIPSDPHTTELRVVELPGIFGFFDFWGLFPQLKYRWKVTIHYRPDSRHNSGIFEITNQNFTGCIQQFRRALDAQSRLANSNANNEHRIKISGPMGIEISQSWVQILLSSTTKVFFCRMYPMAFESWANSLANIPAEAEAMYADLATATRAQH